MLRFIKQIFISTIMLFSGLLSVNSFECISLKNQERKVRPKIVNINSNHPIFYPFNINVNKCSGNCNNISDPYARICVPDNVKNLNVKVFNLISLTDEARHIKWHESCRCICRLDRTIFVTVKKDGMKINVDANVKNYLIKVYARFTLNPSSCKCECDKSCNIGEYLDNKNCKCRKKLVA